VGDDANLDEHPDAVDYDADANPP
jgi:hypothetical protein